MNCLVTAGPTYERLDQVRRLTNFSTGALGVELANFLTAQGHTVTLLIGEQATFGGERKATRVLPFSTTADLRAQLQGLSRRRVDAVFHAAAVSDFQFGKIWRRAPGGKLVRVSGGKISTRRGALLAELVPTPKLIAELRGWFPQAQLIGWKYAVAGPRTGVVRQAVAQLDECATDACVANGPAYGAGFGLVTGAADCRHVRDRQALFRALEKMICSLRRGR